MNEEQEKHLDLLVRNASYLMKKKYRAGQAEHGGNVWDIPFDQLLDAAIDEAIDQYVYLMTLKQQVLEEQAFEQEDMRGEF